MSRQMTCACFGLPFFLLTVALSFGQTTVDAKTLLGKVVRQWKAFDAQFRTSICGKITTRQLTAAGAKGPFGMPEIQTVELKAKPANALVIFPDLDNPVDRMVIAQNPRYDFRLVQRTNQKDWEIRSIDKPGAEPSPPINLFDPVTGLNGVILRSPLAVRDLLLSDVLSRDDLRIDSFRETEDGYVTLSYSFGSAPKFEAKNLRSDIVSGAITIDPKHGYRPIIISYRFATDSATYFFEGNSRFFYDTSSESEMLPIRCESEIVQNGVSLGTTESIYEWSFAGNSLPDEEFTMKSFGLGEPEWVVSNNRGWRIPFAWLGLGFIVFGVVLYFFKANRKS